MREINKKNKLYIIIHPFNIIFAVKKMKQSKYINQYHECIMKAHQYLSIAIETSKQYPITVQQELHNKIIHTKLIDIEILQLLSNYKDLEILYDE